MRYTTLFFDLDDTLYTSGSGLWPAIRDRMTLYMEERLGLPPDEISLLRQKYTETYGTTLRGLQTHHGVEADEFLAFVHDLPLSAYLQPAPALRQMLLSLPQQRWVFTNADDAHARRVLATLELVDCFTGIVDVRAVEYHCKPDPAAYRRALAMAGEADPRRCVFFDDSPRNLAPAHDLGFTTVLVGTRAVHPAATCTLPTLMALPEALPELWER